MSDTSWTRVPPASPAHSAGPDTPQTAPPAEHPEPAGPTGLGEATDRAGTGDSAAGAGGSPRAGGDGADRAVPRDPVPGLLRSLDPLLRAWLPRQRWFAGKGLPIGRLGLAAATELVAPGGRLGPLGLCHVLIDVEQPGRPTDCYQLLLGAHPLLPSSLARAALGPAVGGPYDGLTLYDAPHDPRLTSLLLERLRSNGRIGRLRFSTEPTAEFPPGLTPRISTAEQSNTSVVYGDTYILKLFRRVSPGTNPDLELSLALARAGSRRVAEPVAWFEALNSPDAPDTLDSEDSVVPVDAADSADSADASTGNSAGNSSAAPAAPDADGPAAESARDAPAGPADDADHPDQAGQTDRVRPPAAEPVTLGVLQRFLPGSADGWTLATDSVAEDGDFSADAAALGRATAEVHRSLAEALPVQRLDGAALERIASAMARRLDETAVEVPAIRPYADALRAAFDDLAKLGARSGAADGPAGPADQGEGVLAQRIHGDLHLGQALRGPDGAWVLIDFEGEPARPLAERRRPAPPVQDVAGMLRSFDYAAHHSGNGPWAARHRAAFCAGYAEVSGVDPREQPILIRAFETDKAVYEARYEARHRPAWLPIPLSALARLATSAV